MRKQGAKMNALQISPTWKAYYSYLTKGRLGAINTMMPTGRICGFFFVGPFSNRFGRKVSLVLAFTIAVVGQRSKPPPPTSACLYSRTDCFVSAPVLCLSRARSRGIGVPTQPRADCGNVLMLPRKVPPNINFTLYLASSLKVCWINSCCLDHLRHRIPKIL